MTITKIRTITPKSKRIAIRIERAFAALHYFARTIVEDSISYRALNDDMDGFITDFLTDIIHLCRTRHIDLTRCMVKAITQVEEELKRGDDEPTHTVAGIPLP